MSIIFNAAYVTALVLSSPYFFSKFIISERYRSGLAQRFGLIDARKGRNPCIWIHCASVGEVLTVKSLVKCIEKEFNSLDILISTNTNTGALAARKYFGDKSIFYFPLDLSWIVNRVLNAIHPSCIILIELEIWPNFLIAAAKKHTPVMLMNARISEKSLKWYRILSTISKGFFESLSRTDNVFCARTENDAKRLVNLGIPEGQIFLTGNMKFDNIVTDISEDTKKRLLDLLKIDKDDKVVVCGSTHEGEEAAILSVLKQLKARFHKVRLILAPRHIERVNEVAKIIESMGFRSLTKTSLDRGSTIGERKYETVILLDTIGELLTLYGIADCVFIGKSLIPQGGQNVMEPAGLARPIIVGPHTFNFLEEVRLLSEANAIKVVQDESFLLKEMIYLLEYPLEAKEMGKRAQSVVIKQRGATERNVEVLRKILSKERAVLV